MGTPPTKVRTQLSTTALCGIILFIIFGIALALRVSLSYENVFGGEWVQFGGNDPWYHMRLVENLVQHFPHRIAFDPFTLFPSGQTIPFAPFFDLLLGFFIWVIGLGSPTQHTIETVGAYFPAILGALVTIPVYFIGRELFNRTVGLLSAALIAILPGQYFFRSMLGFTDHHIAEVLFSTTAALFLILAIKRARENETSFSHIRSRNWGNLKKPLIYALLAGLALGIYLDTWSGGLLFVFIVFAYIVIQYIVDHLRGKSTDYLCIIGVPMFLIALIVVIPFLDSLVHGDLIITSLVIGMLTPIALSAVSRLMANRDIKRLYYPLTLAVLGIVGIALLYVIDPSLYHAMVSKFTQVFTPSERAQTIGEVQPLLSLTGLLQAVGFFTTGAFISLISLGLLIYAGFKERSLQRIAIFFIVWNLLMLLAMIGQNRFAYYFAVNVALLTGYFCWRVLGWSWAYFSAGLPHDREGKVAEGKGGTKLHKGYLIARGIGEAAWSTV
jgi:oligosaccharyl transferase (archaeosortase A-associated)